MNGIALIRSRRGLLAKIARELQITRAAVSLWQRVPAERLPDVERITGIPRHMLRDDICLPPRDVGATIMGAPPPARSDAA
jgi:DNA-binding transcriptional regulator YdaS (Cro superfamily)